MALILEDRVMETSTSTGTGDVALSGAVIGFRTFASVCTTNDTVRYVIQGVSGTTPSGEWEVGVGTYSGANTLTRTTVLRSSNANAAVNFAAGTKQVWIGLDATMGSWVRERLSASRTYYVRTDGSDSNTGLANTAGGAFLTIQAAFTAISKLDLGGYAVTVQVADGTYTAGATMVPLVGGTAITLLGNTTTPANCVIAITGGASCLTSNRAGFNLVVNGFKLSSTAGTAVSCSGGGSFALSNIDFGACGNAHVYCRGAGASVGFSTNFTVSGDAVVHMYALDQAVINFEGRTVTFSGTRAFSSFVYFVRGLAFITLANAVFSGTATGPQYYIGANGAIFYSAQTMPGSTAPTVVSGGQLAT